MTIVNQRALVVGWNNDFVDVGSLSRYDSQEHKPAEEACEAQNEASRRSGQSGTTTTDVGNGTQHNSRNHRAQRRANVNNVQARQQPNKEEISHNDQPK